MKALEEYQERRVFEKTPEPRGAVQPDLGEKPVFVIQEHSARTDHFDFRLEIGGMLKSWAVPKNIPIKIGERHLAIETEDHPVDYASFEGTIPKGEYGAGKVSIWDSGSFRNIRSIGLEESYTAGQIEVALDGKKIAGKYALIRTKYRNNPKSWLMLKMKED
jgi:DNA ligase D-like protein (predicted 3'-phosphoesterase)